MLCSGLDRLRVAESQYKGLRFCWGIKGTHTFIVAYDGR